MNEEQDPVGNLPSRLVIVAGTYDGVLAGWDTEVKDIKSNNDQKDVESANSLLEMLNPATDEKDSFLKMNFAMAVHDGSVRSLSIASNNKQNDIVPDTMISCGYDESINTFSLTKQTQSGELKTPSNLGTPTCSSFAPPNQSSPTHVLVGLSSGKIVIYRRKDWSVVHILAGHDDKGVTSIAVHPSGKMALSGGSDGKINLWNLMTGKLAFVHKIPNANARGMKCTINDIIWSNDGKRYAFCTHQGNITARDMETGGDLLNIDLPVSSRPNQICFIGGDDGLFLAAACNDGGLPVFVVGSVDEEDDEAGTRRALMAIEPLEGVATAGEERFKCIQSVGGGSGFLVVTANSGGIISLIDLEGAARMILEDTNLEEPNKDVERSGSESTEQVDEDYDYDEVAAEILCSVRIGSGARITAIYAWSKGGNFEPDGQASAGNEVDDNSHDGISNYSTDIQNPKENNDVSTERKRKKVEIVDRKQNNVIEMDIEAIERARALVSQAKKHENRKKKKRKSIAK